MRREPQSLARRHRGVAAVEFAIVVAVFLMLLLGVMEMGRVMFYWNTATELTRLGARIAAVCTPDATVIKTKMTALYPLIPPGNVSVVYTPAGCNADPKLCTEVTVSVTGSVPITTYIPFVPLSLSLPAFRTTLPRESLQSTAPNGVANPACQ